MALETDRTLRQKSVLVYSALFQQQTQQNATVSTPESLGRSSTAWMPHGCYPSTPPPQREKTTLTVIVSEADEMS